MIPDKLLPHIKRIIKYQPIELSTDKEGKIYLDLNTGMKSHAHMYIFPDHIIIRKRYNESVLIDLDTSVEDHVWGSIIRAIESCACGREYVSYGWARLLEEHHG